MRARASHEVPPPLLRLGQRFSAWRKTRAAGMTRKAPEIIEVDFRQLYELLDRAALNAF